MRRKPTEPKVCELYRVLKNNLNVIFLLRFGSAAGESVHLWWAIKSNCVVDQGQEIGGAFFAVINPEKTKTFFLFSAFRRFGTKN
jgi:hypothetical protein